MAQYIKLVEWCTSGSGGSCAPAVASLRGRATNVLIICRKWGPCVCRTHAWRIYCAATYSAIYSARKQQTVVLVHSVLLVCTGTYYVRTCTSSTRKGGRKVGDRTADKLFICGFGQRAKTLCRPRAAHENSANITWATAEGAGDGSEATENAGRTQSWRIYCHPSWRSVTRH